MKPLRPSLDPAVRKRALDMVSAGDQIRAVAGELHISRHTVAKWLAEEQTKPVVKNITPPAYAKGYLYPGGRGRRWE
jgi:DNA invertase Pin-like site-specific DNA recombinase